MIYVIGILTAGALAYVIYDNYRKSRAMYDEFSKFTSGYDLPEPPPPVTEIDSARLVLLMKRGNK